MDYQAILQVLRSFLEKAYGVYQSMRGVIDNLIAAAIGLLASWIWYGLRNLRRRMSRDSPYYAIWNLAGKHTINVVTGAIRGDSGPEIPRMSSGDINALTEVILSIRAMYPDLEHKHFYSPDFPTTQFDNNLVVIGGPKWNWVSEYFFLTREESPVYFDDYDIVVHTGPDGDRFKARVDNGQITRDAGIICRLPHPDASDRVVFLFAGCHTYGVLAAVRYMSYMNPYSLENVRGLWKRVERTLVRFARSVLGRYRDYYFIAVVEVEVRGDSIGSPTLVRFQTLDSDLWKPTPGI